MLTPCYKYHLNFLADSDRTRQNAHANIGHPFRGAEKLKLRMLGIWNYSFNIDFLAAAGERETFYDHQNIALSILLKSRFFLIR